MTTRTLGLSVPAEAADPKLERVRRAFEAAAGRLHSALTQAEVEDELSNLLHHLYRLGELCRRRLAKPPSPKLSPQDFGTVLLGSDDLRAARAAMWLRAEDTHELVVVDMATPPSINIDPDHLDVYYAVVDWKPLTLIDSDPTAERHKDYADMLQGKPVFDTMRRAFDAVAALL
jgi:hypothetical protein